MINKLRSILKKYEQSLVGYLPIKILEGIILMVTLKMYVGLLSEADYGRFSIFSKTVSMMYLFSVGWIAMAGFRYAKSYTTKGEQEKKEYFSTVVLSYILIILIVILISVVIVTFSPGLLYNEGLKLLLPLILMLIGYGMYQLFITLLIYMEYIRLNMLLVLVASIAKLGLSWMLFTWVSGDVTAMLLSHGIIDIILGSIAVMTLRLSHYVRIKSIRKQMLKTFLVYGYPLIGLSLMMFLLNSSDQYVITIAVGESENGIYAANYTVAASLFTIISMGLNRSVYPRALVHWNNKDMVMTDKTISHGFKYFLLIALPAATGLYLISRELSQLFLNARYIDGYQVIGIASFAMMFYGMSEYMNKGHELKGNTAPILMHCIIAAVVNMALNIVLIPRYGYIIAAYTTLVGFIVYFLLSYIRRSKVLLWHIDYNNIVKIIISTCLMMVSVLAIRHFMQVTVLSFILTIFTAMVVYGGSVFLLGVLKEEFKKR